MKRFKLERCMQYTERLEVEAEDWDAAVKILQDPLTEFERQEDDTLWDDSVEFVGEQTCA